MALILTATLNGVALSAVLCGFENNMSEEQGYTDGGRNPHYEGLFDGETEADRERRIQWAMNEDQLPWPGMMAAFERYYGQSWFDKSYRDETAIWAAAWKAAKTHNAKLTRPPLGEL